MATSTVAPPIETPRLETCSIEKQNFIHLYPGKRDFAPGERGAARRQWRSSNHGYRLQLGMMLAPFLIGTTLLVALPMLLTFALAFAEYDALSAPLWVGVENFRSIFQRQLFWLAVRNTALFVAMAVPLRLLGALGLALLLRPKRRGVGLYRAAIYLPTVIPDIAYALIWLWILNPIYGPLNLLLGWLGAPQPAWLADPQTALLAIGLMSLFQIGEGFLVLLAGLHEIPHEYYETASIDGGNRWQMFWRITLPLLAPWLLLLAVRDLLLLAQSNFVYVYLLTEGGPGYATLLLPLLVYQEAFDRFRFGPASAIMALSFVAMGCVLWGIYRWARRWSYTEGL
jgi:multiple sugar transport system permease protein